MRNVEDLRAMLFADLEALSNNPGAVNLEHVRARCLVADRIIDTMRIEVQLAAVMRGSLEVPFIESQTSERSGTQPTRRRPAEDSDIADAKPLSAVERMTRALSRGPSADHAWRRSGK
ncbi:hypothetical protein [uncultured Pseudacidovorax sp.]|uniref:hypothetical protein n=1 Tax=uncultured Pseudacidovorax sp. TaxID=679313 RepID=UPI0025EECEC0|nr:hypothetical protein [uncultured Pseudacidovorax sp.]